MNKILLTALLSFVISGVIGGQVSAQTPSLIEETNKQENTVLDLLSIMPEPVFAVQLEIEPEPKPLILLQPEKKPRVHVVKDGESLSKISKLYDVSWIRLWQKNNDIKHQDTLEIGSEIVVPEPDEVLEDRMVVDPPVVQTPVRTAANRSESRPAIQQSRNSVQRQVSKPAPVRSWSSSNTYGYGYCTWAVANWTGIPNGWGNANTWASRAASQGYVVNGSPRVGSIAQHSRGGYGHVALVIGIGNGTVTIKEMNYRQWNVVSTRTTSVSDFVYIHL